MGYVRLIWVEVAPQWSSLNKKEQNLWEQKGKTRFISGFNTCHLGVFDKPSLWLSFLIYYLRIMRYWTHWVVIWIRYGDARQNPLSMAPVVECSTLSRRQGSCSDPRHRLHNDPTAPRPHLDEPKGMSLKMGPGKCPAPPSRGPQALRSHETFKGGSWAWMRGYRPQAWAAREPLLRVHPWPTMLWGHREPAAEGPRAPHSPG